MAPVVYISLIIIVAFYGIGMGFRRGITGQAGSLLGFGFGCVFARVMTPDFSEKFRWSEALSPAPEFNAISSGLLCAVTIYIVVYLLFSPVTFILRGLFALIEVGMLNRIAGAFFSLVKNLLWLSIIFNLLICFCPSSRLLDYERANDGNLVAAVMRFTPALLGCYGADDFAHFHQLKEAKKISCNFNQERNVIIKQG